MPTPRRTNNTLTRQFRSAHQRVMLAAVVAAGAAALAAATVAFDSSLPISARSVRLITVGLATLAALAALTGAAMAATTGRQLRGQVLHPLDDMSTSLRRLLIAGVGSNLEPLAPGCAPELREIWNAYHKLVLAMERARAHAQAAIDATASRNRTALDAAIQAEEEKEKGETDPLTGLFNRRRMDADIARDCKAVVSGNGSIAFVMVDVDHFKHANDTWGHQKGDEILQRLAVILRDSIRGQDAAYRYGGEEFSLLLRNISPSSAYEVVERIRATVDDTFGRTDTPVTASFGVALAPRHGNSPSEVIAAADGALYVAKESGRNRVELASMIDPPVAQQPVASSAAENDPVD